MASEPASASVHHVSEHKHGGLGELASTAICGNDITSSCLYVSALAILQAGKYAWVSLLIVAAVLFLFRRIYGEVVGALPLNGGAYNALLNTTSKRMASLAASLTLLSYMATAVISAVEGMHYAHSLWHGLPVTLATIVLLALFMGLTILGIGESSKVAIGIFIFHLASLTLLLVAGGIYLALHGLDVARFNFALPVEGGLTRALFFGFAASMLGISGFESSANFVEEQAEGVFPKTLKNMWIAVSVFNPLMALLALALVRIPDVEVHHEALLSHMGSIAGGGWLSTLISIDAALVLSGAVLTSYVGVTGLVRRMALDRCLPQFFLKTTRRGTTHRIIIGFFLLCVSVLLITKGNLLALAGVYTISFLAVMALFGLGNILLKVTRERLPRPERARWPALIVAIAAVILALIGNVLLNPAYFRVFLAYFVPTVAVVLIMLGRIGVLKAFLYFVRMMSQAVSGVTSKVSEALRTKIEQISSQQMVFFTRGDSLATLNRAVLYVRRNEHTNRIKVVTIGDDESVVPDRLKTDLEFLNEVYPEVDIDFVFVPGKFTPELIAELSQEWKVPINFMFIGSPGDHFLYGLADLGGVRLII
jgi:amino acid transporter